MTNFEDSTNPQPVQNTFGTAVNKKNNRSKLLLALALLILTVSVVFGALWFIISRYSTGEQDSISQNSVQDIDSTVAKVDIKEEGFSPQTIKIKAGQQVTFTNQDDMPHRVVANEETLNDFDSVDMLATGDTYTYVFDTPGTYSYYDSEDGVKFSGIVEVQ